MRIKHVCMAVLITLSIGFTGVANAEYPERPINMIVAAAPGGGTDIMARTMVPYMEKYLGGATISVLNKPGAGTEVGATALAKAKPDGYTIGMLNFPHMIAIPIERKTAFSIDSFELLANLVTDASAFNVSANSPFSTVEDVVKYAKENPLALTVGTTGFGGDDHLAMLAFEKVAGIKLTHVPFPSGAPIRAALMGGHISIGSFNVSEGIEFAKEGQLKILGVMDTKRWEKAPEIPTFKEQGYNVIMSAQRGMGAPKGVPADRLAKLVAAIEKTVKDPEFIAQADKMKLPIDYIAGQAYHDMLYQMQDDLKQMWAKEPWKK